MCDAYLKYSRRLGLRDELVHKSDGHRIVKITGPGAGKAFRNESGKHCVQRIPETESKGRKQTSIVTVGILPPLKKETLQDVPDHELEVITQTGKQKAGGQNANKVASAVRMKHLPTGISVFINGRDQLANRKEAKRIITERVNEMRSTQNYAQYSSLRKSQLADGGRSDKVRTYNFMRSEIVDHQLGKRTSNVKSVLKGEFEVLFDE